MTKSSGLRPSGLPELALEKSIIALGVVRRLSNTGLRESERANASWRREDLDPEMGCTQVPLPGRLSAHSSSLRRSYAATTVVLLTASALASGRSAGSRLPAAMSPCNMAFCSAQANRLYNGPSPTDHGP